MYRAVPLVRQDIFADAGKKALVEKNDSLSIYLTSSFINYFPESILEQATTLAKSGVTRKTGQIAIVVNAFELGDTRGGDFNFTADGLNNGRVVFYSDDVREGQHFNFHNMPIYGPIEYTGAPIGIEIYVVELDVSDKLIGSLMKSLANAGSKAFAPAEPSLKLLSSFGSSLVKANTNDIVFRYRMALRSGSGGHPNLPSAALEVGNYVFIREHDRGKEIPWGKLCFDENTGRIFIKETKSAGSKAKNDTYKAYKENSYMTIQVNKNNTDVSVKLTQNKYSGLLSALEKESKSSTAGAFVEDFHLTSRKGLLERIRIIEKGKALELLGEVKTSQAEIKKKGVNASESNKSKAQLTSSFVGLWQKLQTANSLNGNETAYLKGTSNDTPGELSTDDIEYFLKQIRELLPETTSTAVFSNLTLKNGVNAFSNNTQSIINELLKP